MHNLHIIRIPAADAGDACTSVETLINDWGNENNWRTICGAISQDNELYIHDDSGRYPPEDDSNTIEKIQKLFQTEIDTPHIYADILKTITPDSLDTMDWYKLQEYAKHMYEVTTHRGDKAAPFDIFKDTLYEWQYDTFGLTDSGYTQNEDEKIYFVFVDMHS